MSRETFDCQFELKAAPSDDGRFAGLGAAFGNLDEMQDVIAPGAFAKTLAEHKAAGRMPAMLWQHDTHRPIGTWKTLRESQDGLQAEGQLLLDIQAGREAHSLLKSGAVDGLSIGFRARDATRNKDGTRTLTEIELFEVSLVTFPANSRARVTTVKMMLAAGDVPDKRGVELALRDLGFSVRQAKRFMAGGYDALAPEPEPDTDRDLIVAMQRAGAALGTGPYKHEGSR